MSHENHPPLTPLAQAAAEASNAAAGAGGVGAAGVTPDVSSALAAMLVAGDVYISSQVSGPRAKYKSGAARKKPKTSAAMPIADDQTAPVVAAKPGGDDLPPPGARVAGDEGSLGEGLRVERVIETLSGPGPALDLGALAAAPALLAGLLPEDQLRKAQPPAKPALPGALDDVAPRVGPINDGDTTNDNRPTIRGNGVTPGSTVTVSENGQPLGTVVAGPDGRWQLDTPTLRDGEHRVTVVVTDANGLQSDPSDPLRFIVDTQVPNPPVLGNAAELTGVADDVAPITGQVARNGITNDNRPTFSGTAEPGTTVTLFDNGTPIGSTVTNPDGTWSFTPTTTFLADGPHSVTATATDAAGNESAPTAPFPFVVDTTPPREPDQGFSVTDDVAPVVGEIQQDTVTNDARPTVSGTNATPGDRIDIYDRNSPTPNVPIASTTVRPDGTWSVDTPVLADGPHALYAVATDPAGNSSEPSFPRSFTVDTQGPDLGITLDANVAGDGIVNANEAAAAAIAVTGTVSGTFNAGDIVTITLNGATYTGPVDSAGRFSINVPGAALAGDADRTIDASVTTQDAAGNTTTATDSVNYRLDTDPPQATIKLDANFAGGDGVVNAAEAALPAIAVTGTVGGDVKVGDTVIVTVNGREFTTTVLAGFRFSVDVPGADLAADPDRTIDARVTTVDDSGNSITAGTSLTYGVDTVAPARPVISSYSDDVGEVTGNVASGGVTDDALPRIGGSAEPGATVQVFDGATLIGTALADAAGNWVLDVATPLLNGTRTLTAVAVDAAGNPSAPSEPYTVTIDANGPAAPAITRVDDDAGSVTGVVPKEGRTDDTTPTVVGTAGANLLIRIFDNGTLIGTTTANANGDWSFTPSTALTEGPHSFTAVAVSAAGVPSVPTGPYAIVIDLTAPANTTLDAAADNVGGIQGDIPAAGVTDDNTPTLRGRGEPGATITVLDNGTPIGTTVVAPDGSWQLTPTTALADGPHQVTATATDAAGNTSAPTPALSFTVDTAAVGEPTITRAIDDVSPVTGVVPSGGITNDSTPRIEGSAPPGTTVELSITRAGVVVATLTGIAVDAAGNWNATPGTLPEGTYEFTAVAINAAGTRSNATAPYSLSIDTTAPAAPVITSASDDVGTLQGALANGARTDDATPQINGTGNAGETIQLFDGATLLGTTTVRADGTWSFTPPSTLADGPHEFTARAVDAAGNVSAPSNPWTLIVDTLAPARPVITEVFDDVGSSTGNVPPGGVTDDAQPRIRGTAEPGATVQVFDGPNLIGTATADATGAWTLQLTADLPRGLRTLTAVAIDPAGNPSAPSDPFTFTIDPSLTVTLVNGSATAASEEGLPGGVKDTTGSPTDTTDSANASGALSASGPGGAATSWTLTAPTTPITAGGVAVTWSGSGTSTLTATANGVTVATLTIDANGAYTFTLLAPIDHPVANAEDVLRIDFGVTASNATSSGTGTLSITVEDDAPSAAQPVTREAAVLDTNLLITLDVSGSMLTADGVNGQTRLQSAVQSINALLDRYDEFGEVRVRIVTFSDTAQAVGTQWVTIAEARALLANLTAFGATNYDEALADTISAFSSPGRIAGAQNVAYFFSDGAPNRGSGNTSELGGRVNQNDADFGIQPNEEAAWTHFLNSNQVRAFAIGLGNQVNTGNLDPIAYDGQAQQNTNSVVVTNFNQLDSVLAGTVTDRVIGNLLGASGDLFPGGGLGADAPGLVRSITIDGTTYTYDPANGGSITASGGANRGTFDTATDTLSVITANGGRFVVDMDGGDYRYEAPNTVTGPLTESMTFLVADRDGDTAGSTITVNVNRVTPQVGTTGNDNLAGNDAPNIIMGREGDDILAGNGGGDRVFGGDGRDSIAGNAGNDLLFGGSGNDTINGGDGADRIAGGIGNDQLTGGAGADVFAWTLHDAGTPSARAVDTVTDFDVAAAASGGDVLDLRDMLLGELRGAADAANPNGTVGNLQNFLDFNVVGGNTEIRISSTGRFAGGTYASGSEDQRIVLQGVDIRAALGLSASATDAQIIQELLNRGKLIADPAA